MKLKVSAADKEIHTTIFLLFDWLAPMPALPQREIPPLPKITSCVPNRFNLCNTIMRLAIEGEYWV